MKSIIESGVVGLTIDVECHLSNGLPNILIVGMAAKAIDEAKERIRSSFATTKLQIPRKRITINLAPADIPKDGSSFDLAIAASILAASQQVKSDEFGDYIFIGELGLNGDMRSVRGIIGKILAARKLGFNTFVIPENNLEQAQLIPEVTVLPIRNIRDLYLHMTGTVPIKSVNTGGGKLSISYRTSDHPSDMSDIVGQARAKRAIEIAAAGGHNIMLSGPPGTGKSMLAKAIPSILPPLKREEILEITQLHSLADKNYDRIITERPFRTPHHSASDISIIGGGQHPKPGEISLSHLGVLMFDEFPEFSRPTIEALRQPLEDRTINVARARDSITFPANFILVATCNPCPCGYYGTSKECVCTLSEINRYQKKLSGPILDRIDLFVSVDDIEHAQLLSDSTSEPSVVIQERVCVARSVQHTRLSDSTRLNASLTNREVKSVAKLSSDAKNLLDKAAEQLGISARAYMKIIKVARTIADLEQSETIEVSHLSEALQYRKHEASNIFVS